MIPIGQRNRRVTIIREQQTADGKGGYVVTWPAVKTVWAKVTGLDGRESVMDHVLQGVSVYRINIRYRTDLLPSDRILHAGRNLNILSINDPDGGRTDLDIIADTTAMRP